MTEAKFAKDEKLTLMSEIILLPFDGGF